MKTCAASSCRRAIPPSQHFCRTCLGELELRTRHLILFGSEAERAEAIEYAKKQLSVRLRESVPPAGAANASKEKFRLARQHAANAMKILGRK